jgi:hypothetical protein
MPNWAEQVTAIATAIGAIGLLSAVVAALFAGRQVEEARITRQAQLAVEFFARWNQPGLEETRRLVAGFESGDALRDAFVGFVADNTPEAFVLYRELDYFEQLGALTERGGFDFELVELMLGQRLIDRWELWRPSIEALGGPDVYPLYARLVTKMRAAL